MKNKIGFFGGGNMAEGIIRGLLHSGAKSAEEIFVKELLPDRKNFLRERYFIQLEDDMAKLAEKADILILAVRPQDVKEVGAELKNEMQAVSIPDTVCISRSAKESA